MYFVNILNIWKFYSVHGCVSGLYVLNVLGYCVDISIAIKYFTYILFDQMVGCIPI